MLKTRNSSENFYSQRIDSPIGALTLYANSKALVAVYMEEEKVGKLHAILKNCSANEKTPVLRLAISELKQYFAGKLSEFSVPIELIGTQFQVSVWRELKKIKSGKLRTYSEHATRSAKPSAVRAVSSAIGSNPISIIVPCHRVIGKTGALTGYAGGLANKKWLLAHEGHLFTKSGHLNSI